MKVQPLFVAAATAALMVTSVSAEAQGRSSGRKAQDEGVQEIPVCRESLGVLAIDDAESRWWQRYDLPNPEAIIKIFVQESGCFTLVDRGRGLEMRGLERDLADSGELQRGSNIGAGQVRAADYFLVPDLVGRNKRSGGGGIGGALGGLIGGTVGGMLGRVKVNKKEANVTLSLVNSRTTVMETVAEGYARKSDVSFRGGGGGLFGRTLGAISGSGYENTQIGQVIVLAYLQAYANMVEDLGGLPADPSLAAPQSDNGDTIASAASSADTYGVSREAFNRIDQGMTVDQVSQVIGFDGDRESFAGSVSTYIWRSDPQSTAWIMGTFTDGALTGLQKTGF